METNGMRGAFSLDEFGKATVQKKATPISQGVVVLQQYRHIAPIFSCDRNNKGPIRKRTNGYFIERALKKSNMSFFQGVKNPSSSVVNTPTNVQC